MRAGYLVLAGLVVLGCASREGDRSTEEARARADGLSPSMQVRLLGDSVRLVLHVTNESGAPVSFSFPTSQRYEFTIETADGERVWTWSEGRAFLQALVEAELAAGDTWTFEETWRPGPREGVYVATGRLTSPERPVVQRTTFELP